MASVSQRLQDLFTRAPERLASDPGYMLTRKGASVQHPVVAFPWLQALWLLCSDLCILVVKKVSESLSSAQDDPEAAASLSEMQPA